MSWKVLRFQKEFRLWMTESKEGGAPQTEHSLFLYLNSNATPTPPQIAMMWEAGTYQ